MNKLVFNDVSHCTTNIRDAFFSASVCMRGMILTLKTGNGDIQKEKQGYSVILLLSA